MHYINIGLGLYYYIHILLIAVKVKGTHFYILHANSENIRTNNSESS